MMPGDGGCRADGRAAYRLLSRSPHRQERREDICRARARPQPRNPDDLRRRAAFGGASSHAPHAGRRRADRRAARTDQTGAFDMRYRVLIIVPLLVAAAYLAVCFTIGAGPARGPFMRVEIETVKAFALIGCWTAAFGFDRRDYLRWAWFLSGLCYFFILVRDGVFLPHLLGQGRGIDYVEGGVI